MTLISYAQNGEDIYLERCFGWRKQGLYIDIGASAPVKDSVTFNLYLRGWSGVNIEPIPERIRELKRLRPRDVNLQVAVGSNKGIATLRRTEGIGGLSSIATATIQNHAGEPLATDQLEVEVTTLRDILVDLQIADVQLLKIDAEGFEHDVIKGADFAICRPELILIESVSQGTHISAFEAWEPDLVSQNYSLLYDDGLNRYYGRAESPDLAEAFARPVCVLDDAVVFKSYDNPLRDRRHPEHEWSMRLASNIFRYAAEFDERSWLAIFTRDILDATLDRRLDEPAIRRAYELAFLRLPSGQEVAAASDRAASENYSLRTLIFELLHTEEFRTRLARSLASFY